MIAQKLGGLNALVSSVNIAGPTGAVDEISPEDWRRCLDFGLTGQFQCSRQVVVPMLRAGGCARVYCARVAL
ncbi:3-ketoacyl-ACP reductase [Thioclava atlantica]|uniref:3-ketoacyl-ACP reductase n=2 Tax=Thioclava atlantica TaxID=1317124 RepID=A0A085U0M2_9RHOB|nr:3-ketoacyl-ACP reductase [Thioclava atlantica]